MTLIITDGGGNTDSDTCTISVGVPINLNSGWNLVSLPFVGSNRSIEAVLEPINGAYDIVRHYNSSVIADPWKTYKSGRDPSLSELKWLTNMMGFWIHMRTGGDLLFAAEELPMTIVKLKYGWNLVGYPSFTNRTVADALAGVPWTRLEGFDPLATPHLLRVLSPTDVLSPGTAIWIKVTQDYWWMVQG